MGTTLPRPRLALLALGLALVLLNPGCKNRPPMTPSRPIGITSGQMDTAYEFGSAATDPDRNRVSLHFSWGDGDTSDWSVWVVSGETVSASHVWDSFGTYQVAAQAVDESGERSEWSAPETIAIGNKAPNAPAVPSGPSTWEEGVPCRFVSAASDSNRDWVALRFAWGNGDTTGWSLSVPSGESVTVSHSWRGTGTFWVTAQAKDQFGAVSSWSLPHTIVLINGIPGTPSEPDGPATAHARSTHRFASMAVDPNRDSVSLRFDWGDGDTSNWSVWVPSGESVVKYHAWDSAGAYKIIAQARELSGRVTLWSPPHAIAVGVAIPSTPDRPVGPTNSITGWTCYFQARCPYPQGRGDSVTLRFAWGDGDTSAWSEWTESESTVSVEHSWANPDSYHVTVQARNDYGGLSEWSAYASLVTALPAPGVIKWNYPIQYYTSSPAIAEDDIIYFGSSNYNYSFNALNPNGESRWRFHAGTWVLSSPAIGAEGMVYFGSDDFKVHALDAAGVQRWTLRTGQAIRSSPAIGSDGTIYVGSDDSCLYALHPDGSFKWRFRSGDVRSSPAVGADGTVYFGSDDHCLYAVTPNGTLRWRYVADGPITSSSPAIDSDGTIYVGSCDGYIYALNPDGSLRWRYRTDGEVRSSPVLGSDGTIYVGSQDSCVYALNPDGTRKWSYRTNHGVEASPAVASDGTIYVGSDGLYALNMDGSLMWRCSLPGHSYTDPAIGIDGTVYVGSSGYMNAVIGSAPLADSPWPKFHHDNRNSGRVGGP
jgi:outer membrane protein assembly factor BamB